MGDLVWAWEEDSRALVKRRVNRLFRHKDMPILHVTCFSGRETQQTIEATPEHPFWIEGRGWVAACELQVGDVLKRIDDGFEMHVCKVVDSGRRADVYNFEVDGVHNYFVGTHGVLVHNASIKSAAALMPSQFTGVFVDGEHFQPVPETPPETIAFVARTQQHSNYVSPEALQARAKNFLAAEKAEREISVEIAKALQDPTSLHVQQSSHLAHSLRGLWSDSALDMASRERIIAETEQRTTRGVLGQNAMAELNMSDKSLLHFFVRSEQGPLSVEQLRLLSDTAYSTRAIAVHANQVREASPVLDAAGRYSQERRVAAIRTSKHFSSEQGTDLRSDPGTKIRDELGLPVMYGTAGSASDIASMMQFAALQQGMLFSAPGLGEGGITTTTDIIFDYMRASNVPHSLEGKYARLWSERGAESNVFGDPFLRFSHTYLEIGQAVRMTLAGEAPTDVGAIRRATQLDLPRLLAFAGHL